MLPHGTATRPMRYRIYLQHSCEREEQIVYLTRRRCARRLECHEPGEQRWCYMQHLWDSRGTHDQAARATTHRSRVITDGRRIDLLWILLTSCRAHCRERFGKVNATASSDAKTQAQLSGWTSHRKAQNELHTQMGSGGSESLRCRVSRLRSQAMQIPRAGLRARPYRD